MLGIILLNWNQAADTLACARTILAWPELPCRIWVVDNASEGPQVQQLQQLVPDVTLICSQRNRGFAGGNNLAITQALAAGCQEILLLNNDAMITPANVMHLQNAVRQKAQVGIAGPTLWDSAQPDRLLSAGGEDIGTAVATHISVPPADDEIRPVTYVPGTCILIRREVFAAVGLLDEAYFFGGEVADLCMRARQCGFDSVIVGNARATHSLARSADMRHWLHIYYVLRNRFLFVRKFHPQRRRRLFVYWTGHSLKPWLQAVWAGDWPRERAIRLACLDGWRGRFGGQNRRVSRGQIA